MTALLLLSALLAPAGLPPGTDWIIPAGVTIVYDTSGGPVSARNVVIEEGGKLRVVGTSPFRLEAARRIQIDGVLDLSGQGFFLGGGVATLNTTNVVEEGRAGGPGGGRGGRGNPNDVSWSTAGGPALDPFGVAPLEGGRGGESGFHPSVDDHQRRPGGGGGGVLGPDLALLPQFSSTHLLNLGRIARPGFAGAVNATGVLSGQSPPQGGAAGPALFVDGNPDNDFWGRKVDPLSGLIITGELTAPLAGRGGGGGGNAIQSSSWPPAAPWTTTGDEKGCGGGGGGGLGLVSALEIRLGHAGKILANGGNGGGGENSAAGGITHIGGGSGGGSGGMLVLQARVFDLREASARAVQALGGAGGYGADNLPHAVCAGGDGGPGLIQIHVPAPTHVLLPPGGALERFSVPPAHVLLQEPLP